jgi:hypothetical protein
MKRGFSLALAASASVGALLSYSCAKSPQTSSGFEEDSGASSSGSGGSSSGTSGSGSGGSSGASGSSSGGSPFFDGGIPDVIVPPGSDGGIPTLVCPNPGQHDDFMAPVIDMGAPANSAALFAAPDVGTDGPCMYEPESGALFPNNWIRLRFRFTTTHKENLFEIKLIVPNETNPLVIYTTANPYTLHALAWQAITTVGVNQPIVLSVRSAVVNGSGAVTGGPWAGTTGGIEIAPVPAAGSVVYWTTSNKTLLKGFQMGNESPPQPVLAPTQLQNVACVGCHTSTPDGDFVGVTVTPDPTTGDGPAFIDIRSADGGLQQPSFATPSAIALLSRPAQHVPAFSPGHWTPGDRIALTMWDQNVVDTPQIVWTNLEAKGQTQGTDWDFLPRNGDPNPYAGAATFSHDGANVVYESTMETVNSGITVNDSVLYVVPFNGGKGGTASPLNGADDSTQLQYYPAYSHDDAFIAFNRAPATAAASSYSNQDGEVFIVPASGGTATRLAANDPPACLHETSPGIQNSWPKWSPQVFSACGNTYYFLVFSSERDPMSIDPTSMMPQPQLYVAPIVVSPGGAIKTYSALYLWNQPEAEHNHTPAWDNFQIPPPPPMPPPPQ